MRRIVAPILLTLLLATLLLRLPGAVADRAETLERLDPLIESRRILREAYAGPIDDPAAVEAAVAGYVRALGDPFTEYVPPADQESFDRDLRGEYAGIGAEVNMIDGRFIIISPMPESPALAAGLRAGDVIVSVAGEPVAGLSADQIIDRLLGPPGTEVTVGVERDGEDLGQRRITRRRIVAPTVRGLVRAGEGWDWCLDAATGIRYVRITQFNAATAIELTEAVDEAAASPADAGPIRGLVLDLRDNPGGDLGTAIAVADLFLDAGVIVQVVPRDGPRRTAEATPDRSILREVPMVVLINGSSASAAEIVAGALGEAGRALVVGSRTYGKGSVQEVRTLETAGGTRKFTVAEWRLASDRPLQRRADSETWGVDPSEGWSVPLTDSERIETFERRRSLEAIRRSDEEFAAEGGRPDCRSIAWVREQLGDRQLLVAAEALATRITTGDWPRRSADRESAWARATEIAGLEALQEELRRQSEEVAGRLAELVGGDADGADAAAADGGDAPR
ncbi:MAG: S41 family peptidase [Planctomycetota bacterium]|jgi:carboxyl-terminal processing protease